MQLCLLSFPSLYGAERDEISFCARATLLYNQWRDPNAICCFLARGTCFNMLETFRSCNALVLLVLWKWMSVLWMRWYKKILFWEGKWFIANGMCSRGVCFISECFWLKASANCQDLLPSSVLPCEYLFLFVVLNTLLLFFIVTCMNELYHQVHIRVKLLKTNNSVFFQFRCCDSMLSLCEIIKLELHITSELGFWLHQLRYNDGDAVFLN